jgi:hypothetical protein
MRSPFVRALTLWLILASLGVLACDLSTVTGLLGTGTTSKPRVTILAPTNNAQFKEGDEIQVQSTSTDSTGIVRVELLVDGATVATDVPPIPKGQTLFTLIQRWKATPGQHTLGVRAFNAAGVASDPALVTVVVTPLAVLPTPMPTQVVLPPLGVSPTVPRPTATVALPTLTRAPTRPPASPTISAPPGVYATAIRVEPASPKRNQPVMFHVTFLNTTGAPQMYRWRVIIFPPDSKNAKGDTAFLDSTIAPGTSTLTSPDNWTIRGPGPCEDYIARVFWIDENKQPVEFLKPDRSGGPAVGFQICP